MWQWVKKKKNWMGPKAACKDAHGWTQQGPSAGVQKETGSWFKTGVHRCHMNNKEKLQLPKAKIELEITRKLEVTEIMMLPRDGGVRL